MLQPRYGEHIAHTVERLPYEAVIQTKDIARHLAEQFALPYDRARTATNVKLKRMADSGKIERLQKGVYCHVRYTVFGKTTPNVDEMMARILTTKGAAKIGYETGASLYNRLGLTTLLPREIEIATNSFGTKLPENCRIKPRKPAAAVTNENWKYLQFIDVISALPDAHIDAERPVQILRRFAKNQQLDTLALIFTARRHYSAKIVLQLIDFFMEV